MRFRFPFNWYNKFGTIPSEFREAMSYEEQILWLCQAHADLKAQFEAFQVSIDEINETLEALQSNVQLLASTLEDLKQQVDGIDNVLQQQIRIISQLDFDVANIKSILNNGYVINKLTENVDLSNFTLSEGYYYTGDYQVLDTSTEPSTPLILEGTLFYYFPLINTFKTFPNSTESFFELVYNVNNQWTTKRFVLTNSVDNLSTSFEIPTALAVYEAIQQGGGSGIETISEDSNVWQLNEGFYIIDKNVVLSYDDSSTTYQVRNSKALLMVSYDYQTSSNRVFTYLIDTDSNGFLAIYMGNSADLGGVVAGSFFKVYDYDNPPQLKENISQSITGAGNSYRYPSTKAVVDYVAEKVPAEVQDTGWIDMSAYVNTSNASIRSGFPPECRRIGDQIYWRGEVYCSSSTGSKTITLLRNLPAWCSLQGQFSSCGCHYQSGVYNIFAEWATIIASEASNISTTSSTSGYQLTNLWGYFTSNAFPDNRAPVNTKLLMHFDGNLNNEVTGDTTGITGTYATTTGKFNQGQITSASSNDIFLSGFSPNTSASNWGIGFWSYDSGSLWNGATIYAKHLTTNQYVPLINIGSHGVITPGSEAMTFSNGQSTQRSIYQYQYSYVSFQIENGNEWHGYYNGQESYTCLISSINVDLNDLVIRSVDSSKIDELIIAEGNVSNKNEFPWVLRS